MHHVHSILSQGVKGTKKCSVNQVIHQLNSNYESIWQILRADIKSVLDMLFFQEIVGKRKKQKIKKEH